MDIVKFFKELRQLKNTINLKVSLTKEELDDIGEDMMLTDYQKPENEVSIRKVHAHESQASEIFSKRSVKKVKSQN